MGHITIQEAQGGKGLEWMKKVANEEHPADITQD
jgi:hypothetical protein